MHWNQKNMQNETPLPTLSYGELFLHTNSRCIIMETFEISYTELLNSTTGCLPNNLETLAGV